MFQASLPSHPGHSAADCISFDLGDNTRSQMKRRDESRHTINVQGTWDTRAALFQKP